MYMAKLNSAVPDMLVLAVMPGGPRFLVWSPAVVPATLARYIADASCVCVSVCLCACLCVGIVSKRLNIGSRKQRRTIAQKL